jgi:hypothetical protein
MSIYRSEKSLVDTFVRHLRSRESIWGKVRIRREFDFQRGRTDILAVDGRGQVFAFEAKLQKWRDALHQAYRNTCFAHESYVLLPSRAASIALQFPDEFEKRNVGLCYLDRGRVVVVRKATKQQPLQPWLRELAVRCSREGHERKSPRNRRRSLRNTKNAVRGQGRRGNL